MLDEIKIFGGKPFSVKLLADETIVPGDIVKWSASGWLAADAATDDFDLQESISINHLGLAVGYSAAAAAVTMGITQNDHVDAIQWGQLSVVVFGADWTGTGAFSRKSEVLVPGDLLVVKNGQLEKFARNAASTIDTGTFEHYMIVAEVVTGSDSATGAIGITTVGYPQIHDSVVGTKGA